MTGNERDLIGPFVLGTLDDDEKRSFEAALARDPELARAVDRFAAQIQGLDATAPVEPVTPGLWSRIESQLQPQVASPLPAPNPRRPVLPAWASIAASIVLAASIGFGVGHSLRPELPQPVVIAVLVTDTQAPGAIVEAFANNSVHIIPLEAIDVPEGKILEVWTKPNEEIGPVSLGRFLRSMEIVLPATELPVPQGGQLYEITLEDAPGSPTGKPTGPILFKGLAQRPV
jgi:anti-sigma-K factor RskA